MASMSKPRRRVIPGKVGSSPGTAAKPIRRPNYPIPGKRKPSKVNTQVRKSKSFSNSAPPRTREHLTPGEVGQLLKVARRNRYGCRDHALVLTSYTHGLRVSEAIAARWEDFDLKAGVFHVHRLKGSISGDHFLRGVEIRTLRQLKREGPASAEFVFASERGGRLSVRGVQKMIERLASRAGLAGLKVHPHMMRHSCGYYLADIGTDLRVIQQYLGHKNIRHTVRYTALSPRKFRRLWDD